MAWDKSELVGRGKAQGIWVVRGGPSGLVVKVTSVASLY